MPLLTIFQRNENKMQREYWTVVREQIFRNEPIYNCFLLENV